MLHYICSLPNRGEPGKIRELISDNPRAIEAFARQEDRPGRGVFDCVSLLRPGASRRSLEDVGEVRELFVDIDAKDLVDDLAAVDKRLTALPLLPSQIRNSGHGRHVGWRLKEPIDAADSAELSRAAAVLKRLTACLCGDMAVAHLAALLRHPGTHNSKNGEWHEVGYVLLTDTRYDLGDIDDWLDDLGSRSLFTRRPADSKHDKPPHVVGERNPPVDVEARLAAMKLHGPGDSSVHKTQLSCTASLLRTGMSLEETTRTVLEATRAVGDSKWNWRLEELKIMRMGADFVAKNPELLSLLPDGWQQPFEAALAQGYHPDISRNQGGLYVRVWKKWKDSKNRRYRKGAEAAEDAPADTSLKVRPHSWNYFDSTKVEPQRWLVKQLLPETGIGIVSGQWGSFKTTAALELAVAVMTGKPFAGQYRIKRRGAVLYFATEGSGTLQSRLSAIARHRGASDKLPFAWRGDCPLLTDREAGRTIVKYVDEAAVHLEHAYGVPVTLIFVDTYITAAGLNSSGDDNDVAATQKAFNTLRFVSAHSKAFVATIDHIGKAIEAGTRGSSGKEGNADTVLATLADREITGAVSNSRMTVRKQRDGISGFQVPFIPEIIELGLDEDGDAITAVVLTWGKQEREPIKSPRKSKDRDLLAKTLMDAIARRGFVFHPEPGGPTVQACHEPELRAAFCQHRPAKGTAKQQADKRRNAYDRALASATETGLIVMREVNGEVVVWPR